MVTLAQVAARAGTSPSTVSRVLSGSPPKVTISEATRERVVEAARSLGYHPSGAARAMRRGRTRTIGILGTSPGFFARGERDNAFVTEATFGILQAASARDHHATFLTGSGLDEAASIIDADLGFHDGLLVFNFDFAGRPNHLDKLTRLARPTVFALDGPPGSPDLIAPPEEQGGVLAVQHLVAAGRCRIGFLRRRYFPGIFDRREAGWRKGLQQADVLSDDLAVFPEPPESEVAFRERKLDAIVCANHVLAASTLDQLDRAGIAVPDEIAVVGFGVHGVQADPRIAFVHYDLRAVVGDAVHRLIDRIEGRPIAREATEHRYRWVPATPSG